MPLLLFVEGKFGGGGIAQNDKSNPPPVSRLVVIPGTTVLVTYKDPSEIPKRYDFLSGLEQLALAEEMFSVSLLLEDDYTGYTDLKVKIAPELTATSPTVRRNNKPQVGYQIVVPGYDQKGNSPFDGRVETYLVTCHTKVPDPVDAGAFRNGVLYALLTVDGTNVPFEAVAGA